MKRYVLLMLCSLMVFLASPLKGQQKLQVVTKSITHKITDLLDSGLVVEGRKADIEITGWDRDYIMLEIELVSKHVNRRIAETELDYIQYAVSRVGEHYLIRNLFYAVDGKTRSRSSLGIKYRLSVPVSQPVRITNDYGSASLTGLRGALDLQLRFNDVVLKNYIGSLTTDLSYCNFEGEGLDGNLNLQSRKSDITLDRFAGDVVIRNTLGRTNLSPMPLLHSLDVNSRRGEVVLNVNTIEAYNYDVLVNESFISLPEAHAQLIKIDADKQSRSFNLAHGQNKAKIRIVNHAETVQIAANNNE